MHILKYYISSVRNMHPTSYISYCDFNDDTGQILYITYIIHIHTHDIREGNGTPLQYSCLENPMYRGAWQAADHGVSKSRTRLSNFTFTFHFHFSLSCAGEGHGNPLHCSCLENPRDGGAWWAAVYGVTQSRT